MRMIRLATKADLTEINNIYNETVVDSTATFDTEPPEEHVVLVLEEEGSVIGWASLNPYSDRNAYKGTVENSIYFYKKYSGRGFGTLLLTRLLESAKAHGLHTILARMCTEIPNSIYLHRKLGFETVGVMREVGFKFDRWLDVEIMQYLIK